MNNTRYGKGRFNGAKVKIQPRNFEFDEDKANSEEDFLKKKHQEIGVPGNYTF